MFKYHMWEQEVCMEFCRLQTKKTGHIIETVTAVIDVNHMSLSHVNSDFYSTLKGIANIDSSQYPETMGRVFIINTPSAFPIAWAVMKAFLDPVVASKIHIYSSESVWKPKLFDYIGEENIPSTYGGKAPALSSNVHPYSEIFNVNQF